MNMVATRMLTKASTSRAFNSLAHLSSRAFTSKVDSSTLSEIKGLLTALRELDTACLCDADKSVLGTDGHIGLKLMDSSIRPINFSQQKHIVMAGVARTVQCTDKDDFLAVLRGMEESQSDDVLLVNTLSSTRAVAGELFCSEAQRKGLAGIVLDGPIRDTAQLEDLSVRCYATSITPYSGSTQSGGSMQTAIQCCGIEVIPGDIVMGDNDGIIVGKIETFQELLPIARGIHSTEATLREAVSSGSKLTDKTNYEDHLKNRRAGKESSLAFRI